MYFLDLLRVPQEGESIVVNGIPLGFECSVANGIKIGEIQSFTTLSASLPP